MEVTALGQLLLPLCVLLALSPYGLLLLVQVSSVFGAAAALILGGAGVQPALLPALLLLGCLGLQALLGAPMPAAGAVLRLLAPLLLLGLYALLSAAILPLLFDGTLAVWPQKPLPPDDLQVVLHPSLGNLTQSAYLVIDLGLLCLAAIHLAPRPAALARLLTAFLLSGYAVVAFCLWQLANKLAGVPFPETLLFSNPGWAILSDQSFGNVPRISGPFSEPASLAFFLCGTVYACAWLLIRGHRHKLAAPLLPLSLLCLLLSTSTSGFVVLAIGIVFCAFYTGFRAVPAEVARVLKIAIPSLAGVALATGLLLTCSPQLAAAAAMVLGDTLDKGHSSSFAERSTEDWDSLVLFFASYGLGVGWGSNRSSSLVPGLLAGLGLPGVVLLMWFFARLRAACRARSASMAIDGFGAATLGSLLTAVVSAPMIVSAGFYLNLAGLLAAVVANRKKALLF